MKETKTTTAAAKTPKVVLVKSGQNRRECIRAVDLARRMVGMYRLAAEQATIEEHNSMGSYVGEYLSDSRWRKFKKVLHKNLVKSLLNDKTMAKIVANQSKDMGGLNDLVYGKDKGMPKQAFLIRTGNILEASISEFLCDVYTPYHDELTDSIKSIAGYNIQRDVSVRKGDVVVVAELKCNYNLDTEKVGALVNKVDLLNIACKDALKDKGLTPIVCMTSLRYSTTDDMPKMKPALEAVRTQYMIGYTQFFNFFDIKVTKTMWENLLDKVSEEVTAYYENFIGRN